MDAAATAEGSVTGAGAAGGSAAQAAQAVQLHQSAVHIASENHRLHDAVATAHQQLDTAAAEIQSRDEAIQRLQSSLSAVNAAGTNAGAGTSAEASAEGHIDGTPLPKLVDGWPQFPTVRERYFTTYTTGNHQCVHHHSNGLLVLGVSPGHPSLQPPNRVTAVKFRSHDGKNLLNTAVSGKKKAGAVFVSERDMVCTLDLSDGSEVTMYACVRGNVIEINERLLTHPELVSDSPHSDGYLCIMLPKLQEKRDIGKAVLQHICCHHGQKGFAGHTVGRHSLLVASATNRYKCSSRYIPSGDAVMTSYEILAAGGAVAILLVIAHVLTNREATGSALLAAVLSAAFFGYTAITIFKEGVVLVWTNHTTNLWGVQVWWDLLFATGTALFFIVPRARAAGMNIVPWVIFTALTASIGLLAMVARLFWLEKRTTR